MGLGTGRGWTLLWSVYYRARPLCIHSSWFPILIPLVSTSPILLYFLKVQSFRWSHAICSLFLCSLPLVTAFDSDMRRGVSLLLCLLPYHWPLGSDVWSLRPIWHEPVTGAEFLLVMVLLAVLATEINCWYVDMRWKKEKKGRILGYHDWEKIVLTR